MINSRQKIRVIFLLFSLIFLCFLIYKKISNVFTVKYDFSTPYHPFISTLRPDERVGDWKRAKEGNWYQILINEPIYFDIETPKDFRQAELRIKYKNEKQKDFKAGILVDRKNWNYKLDPLENKQLDRLIGEWNSVRGGEEILLQRSNKFNTIDAFLEKLPSRGEIALYNYKLTDNFLISKYSPAGGFYLPCPLKGYHQFYIYIKNEPLDLFFNFYKTPDAATGEINIYSNNKLIEKNILNKDTLPDVKIFKENLPEGVYKVEIKVNDEFIINKLTTGAHLISFINNIHLLAPPENKEVKLYTDSPYLKFSTSNGRSLQKVKFKDKILNIDEVYKEYLIEDYMCDKADISGLNYCLAEAKLKKGDIIIQGAGSISFTPDSFINPEYKQLEILKNLDGINYVFAKYRSPEKAGEWQIGTASFDLVGIKRDGNKYNFILSAQGIDKDKAIELYEIKAEFRE